MLYKSSLDFPGAETLTRKKKTTKDLRVCETTWSLHQNCWGLISIGRLLAGSSWAPRWLGKWIIDSYLTCYYILLQWINKGIIKTRYFTFWERSWRPSLFGRQRLASFTASTRRRSENRELWVMELILNKLDKRMKRHNRNTPICVRESVVVWAKVTWTKNETDKKNDLHAC